jgi:hypothetical protein
MTAIVMFTFAYSLISLLAAIAWASLAISKRRDRRIQAERDAANVRTWAHIVESADADWRAWRLEMEESR